MKNLELVWGAALLSLLFTVPVYADLANDADAGRELPAVASGAGVTSTAIVEAIDLDNRIVTLRTEDDGVVSLAVSEEARNLPQVKVGDRVVVTRQMGLAMALAPAGDGIRERVDTMTIDRTELGQKPGGTLRKSVRATAIVRAIDQTERTVTLQGALQTVVLNVGDNIDLANFRIGDEVEALYQESLVISVEPAPPVDSK